MRRLACALAACSPASCNSLAAYAMAGCAALQQLTLHCTAHGVPHTQQSQVQLCASLCCSAPPAKQCCKRRRVGLCSALQNYATSRARSDGRCTVLCSIVCHAASQATSYAHRQALPQAAPAERYRRRQCAVRPYQQCVVACAISKQQPRRRRAELCSSGHWRQARDIPQHNAIHCSFASSAWMQRMKQAAARIYLQTSFSTMLS